MASRSMQSIYICQKLERVFLVVDVMEAEEPKARKRPRLDAV